MHGGFENETPNIPTNTIMKLDLLQLLAKTPTFLTKLEQTGGQKSKAAKSDRSTTQSDNSDGSRSTTPPMQNLVRMKNKIKLDKAEVEAKPGAGKTV
jgi:hypothetical protein